MKKQNLLATALPLAAMLALASMSGISSGDSGAPKRKHLNLENYSMPFIDTGEGEPVVFVHGAVSDLRTWSDYLKPISKNNRFVSYSRRWYGDQEWPNGTPIYSHDQHASDLASLIESLGAGPVHLVTWSSGAVSSTILAAERPELVKSIVHFEPVLDGVMEGVTGADKIGEEWRAQWGPVVEAAEAGHSETAGRKLIEIVFELPEGGFDSIPKANQDIVKANSRTVPLMFFSNETKTNPDCDFLGKINAPTVVLLGAETNPWWTLMSETISSCMSNASLRKIEGVNHNGPIIAVDDIVDIIEQTVASTR